MLVEGKDETRTKQRKSGAKGECEPVRPNRNELTENGLHMQRVQAREE